jgi:serine/threonine protein kinase
VLYTITVRGSGQPPAETVKDKYAKPIPTNLSRDAQEFLKCCLMREPKLRSSASQLLNHVFILNNTQLKKDPSPRTKNSSIDFPYDCKYLDSKLSEEKCYRVQSADTFRYSGPHFGSTHDQLGSGERFLCTTRGM